MSVEWEGGKMANSKLKEQLVELALKGERTGLVLLDAIIDDALEETRMATKAELEEIHHVHECIVIDLEEYRKVYKKAA